MEQANATVIKVVDVGSTDEFSPDATLDTLVFEGAMGAAYDETRRSALGPDGLNVDVLRSIEVDERTPVAWSVGQRVTFIYRGVTYQGDVQAVESSGQPASVPSHLRTVRLTMQPV